MWQSSEEHSKLIGPQHMFGRKRTIMTKVNLPDDLPDNLPPWVEGHVRIYVESAGAAGHLWDSSVVPGGLGPVPTLLLMAVGRHSGTIRPLPLIYAKTGADYVIAASKGGRPRHPAWYLNLLANPEVAIWVATERLVTKARTAVGEEREALWAQMVAIYPPYVDYQAKTDRVIPVVVLERLNT